MARGLRLVVGGRVGTAAVDAPAADVDAERARAPGRLATSQESVLESAGAVQ
jgi:hypothetical protein